MTRSIDATLSMFGNGQTRKTAEDNLQIVRKHPAPGQAPAADAKPDNPKSFVPVSSYTGRDPLTLADGEKYEPFTIALIRPLTKEGALKAARLATKDAQVALRQRRTEGLISVKMALGFQSLAKTLGARRSELPMTPKKLRHLQDKARLSSIAKQLDQASEALNRGSSAAIHLFVARHKIKEGTTPKALHLRFQSLKKLDAEKKAGGLTTMGHQGWSTSDTDHLLKTQQIDKADQTGRPLLGQLFRAATDHRIKISLNATPVAISPQAKDFFFQSMGRFFSQPGRLKADVEKLRTLVDNPGVNDRTTIKLLIKQIETAVKSARAAGVPQRDLPDSRLIKKLTKKARQAVIQSDLSRARQAMDQGDTAAVVSALGLAEHELGLGTNPKTTWLQFHQLKADLQLAQTATA